MNEQDSSDSTTEAAPEPTTPRASRKRSLINLSEFAELQEVLDRGMADSLEAARLLRTMQVDPGAGTPTAGVGEPRSGHALGQWVLAVRCDCGRRWFELRETFKATCPRCGSIVDIEIEINDESV
jgi:hypothetical protein